jgi:phage/plasmid-associated DNA primase
MPPRGRPKKQKKEEDDNPSMQLHCFIDTACLAMLQINRNLEHSLLGKTIGKLIDDNILTSTYSKKKGREWDEWIGDANSPTRMSKQIRGVLCALHNIQLDLYSATSTFAEYLSDKYELDCSFIKQYNHERDRGLLRDLIDGSHVSADTMKKYVNSSLAGSDFIPDGVSVMGSEWLSNIKREYTLIFMKACDDPDFKHIHSFIMTSEEGHPPANANMKFMSAVYRSLISAYIECVMKGLSQFGYSCSGIIGDAILVNKSGSEGSLDSDDAIRSLIIQLQSFVLESLQIRVCIKHKSLELSKAEAAFLTAPFSPQSVITGEQCTAAINIIFNTKLRDQHGSLYVPVDGVAGAFSADDHSVEYYLNLHLRDAPFLSKQKGLNHAADSAASLNSRWFKNVFDQRDSVIAFTNGVFDMETLQFRPLRPHEFTRIFYKQAYHERLIEEETPLWEKLVKTQWADDEYVEFAEAMMGRTLYPLLYDRWEKMLFIGGHSQSGKSTMLEVLMECHPKGTVSVMSAGSNSFSLADHLGKHATFCMDIPQFLDTMLERSTWLSMISGEMIKVNIKFKKGRDVRWQTHLVWAGNYAPRYKDAASSAERRMVILQCNNPVVDVDTKLKEKIIRDELPILHIRFLHRYRALKEKVGSDSIDKYTPPQIMQTREEVSYSNNALKAFIEQGSKRCVVERVDDDEFITLREFNDAFSKFQKFGFDGGVKDRNYVEQANSNSFVPFGIRTAVMKQCKVCKVMNPTSYGCGDHYQKGKNKTTAIVVHGIKIRMVDAQGNEQVAGVTGQIWLNNQD